jgi:hypothetical protein
MKSLDSASTNLLLTKKSMRTSLHKVDFEESLHDLVSLLMVFGSALFDLKELQKYSQWELLLFSVIPVI